jgi:hypothetical protein
MRYLASAIATVAVGLWLGGLVTLILLINAVFISSGLATEMAGKATGIMFVWFAKGQLVVAGVALLAAFWGYLLGRSRVAMGLFAALALAAVGAVVFNVFFVTRLEEMRVAGEMKSAAFHALHEQARPFMTGLTLLVLVATLLLPAFCRGLTPRAKSEAA